MFVVYSNFAGVISGLEKNDHALFRKTVCSYFLKQQTYAENCNRRTGCRLMAKNLRRMAPFAGQIVQSQAFRYFFAAISFKTKQRDLPNKKTDGLKNTAPIQKSFVQELVAAG
ncbi:MAG: hypothetical protein J7599_05645 [Niabella sp.]|nr:hypothetical protein [Niabella sp.]